MVRLLFFSQLVIQVLSAALIPSVTLGNERGTAQPGLMLPAIGLGTGAYSNDPTVGYGGYPECFSSISGCGEFAERAVTEWLSVGGRRIDSANSYQDMDRVGMAMNSSNVSRGEIFLLSKVGPSQPLGFQDTLTQFQAILDSMGTTYVDSLLVHWPWPSASKGNVTNNATQSSDPLCNTTATTTYDEKGCRLSTWRAMLQIYESGKARSIGVSNYNITHFEEIRLAGLPLPALTQSPFHLYLSSSQMDILSYCWRHGIVFLGYSPFGVPDYKVYNASLLPSSNELTDPVVTAIASSHAVTPAQVLLAWQWQLGIPTNPRSMNRSHMEENLAAYSALTLNQTEVHLLNTRPQDMCSFDSSWYECAGSSGPY